MRGGETTSVGLGGGDGIPRKFWLELPSGQGDETRRTCWREVG